MKKNVDVKRLIIGSVLLVAAVFFVNMFSGGGKKEPLSEKYDEAALIAEAKEVIEYFNARDYQSIIDISAESMTESVTAESLAEKCDELLDECGAFIEFDSIETAGSVDEDTGEEYGGVILAAEYEEKKAQFNVWFNENMELIQFVVQ